MNVSLTVNLQLPTQAVQDYVQLEQEEWKETNNIVTKSGLADFMSSILYGNLISSFNCKVGAGYKFQKFIYAYPSPGTLLYQTGTTYGTKMAGVREQIDIEETLSFSLSTSQTLRYPPSNTVSVRTIPGSDFYDSEGNRVPIPRITVNAKEVTISEPVYGSLKATYKTYRHTYLVFVPVREEAVENRFQSVFYARWDGGVNLEAIEVPNNADSDYEAGLDCKSRSLINGGDTEVSAGDGFNPPVGFPSTTTEGIDYCTQLEK